MNCPHASWSWSLWFVAGGLAGLGLARLAASPDAATLRHRTVERLLLQHVRALLKSRDEWVNRAGDLYQDTVVLGDAGVAGMVGRLRS